MLSKTYVDTGCMYVETFGCMYADVGCKSVATFGCNVCGCWVQVCGDVWVQSMRLLGACMWKRLGACMRLLGASLIAADSLPDSRWLHSPRVSSSLGPGAPRGPAPKQSKQSNI